MKPLLTRTNTEDTTRFALVGATAILPDRLLENSYIEFTRGLLTRVGKAPKQLPKGLEVIDVTGKYLAPGWIDIHVHGGAGADFMDGTQQAIETAARAHLKHGTTTMFPTTTTGSQTSIMKMIQAVADASKANDNGLPTLEGVHLYGPYFLPEKSGCHKKTGCRTPERDEFESYFKTGWIRIATCAAELPGADAFYRAANKRGCLITCGHSDASWSEMAAAHKLGMSHVDHFWCAMSSVPSVRARLGSPMQGSMAEFVLANSTMSTEVIADGFHLAPELLQFAWQIKGSKMLALVSDTSRALDMPPGQYTFGDPKEEVWIESTGKVGLNPTGGLASSVVALDHCVRHMAKVTKIPLHEIVRMATLTPAERTGIAESRGSLEKGKRSDVLVLNNKLNVERVFYCGN
ncbi:MAG: N-acetylglucosamine-6-phosphate deacetylase [Planctomycetota bacterium]|jgi:N-acetylglucosamine-6-phosphate deacetylase